MARKRHLVGRTIQDVRWNRFATGRRGRGTTDPEFVLDNGDVVRFTVAETEVGEYGIEVVVWTRKDGDWIQKQ